MTWALVGMISVLALIGTLLFGVSVELYYAAKNKDRSAR